MRPVSTASVIETGIDGDRRAAPGGTRKARQVLLMDRETLETLDLKPGEIRENITVSGLDFTTLEAGHRVSLGGAAVVEVTGPCAPCSRMDEIRPGLKDELQGRRGKLAFVVETGRDRHRRPGRRPLAWSSPRTVDWRDRPLAGVRWRFE